MVVGGMSSSASTRHDMSACTTEGSTVILRTLWMSLALKLVPSCLEGLHSHGSVYLQTILTLSCPSLALQMACSVLIWQTLYCAQDATGKECGLHSGNVVASAAEQAQQEAVRDLWDSDSNVQQLSHDQLASLHGRPAGIRALSWSCTRPGASTLR